MNFLFFNLTLIVAIIFLFIILSWVWPPDSPWAPWWTIKDKQIHAAFKLAKVTKEDIIFDLGCGNGRLLILSAREFGARGVGIEIDPLRFFIAKFLVKKNGVEGKITIIKDNFNKQDISSATVVFLYLVPKALERLKPKLLQELKSGTRIITYKYQFSMKKVGEDKKNHLFLYKL